MPNKENLHVRKFGGKLGRRKSAKSSLYQCTETAIFLPKNYLNFAHISSFFHSHCNKGPVLWCLFGFLLCKVKFYHEHSYILGKRGYNFSLTWCLLIHFITNVDISAKCFIDLSSNSGYFELHRTKSKYLLQGRTDLLTPWKHITWRQQKLLLK